MLDVRSDLESALGPGFDRRRNGPRTMAADASAEGRGRGLTLRLRGSIPRSVAGRVAVGAGVLAGLGAIGFGLAQARAAVLHDARLAIPSSRNIQISGNNHLTRAQVLGVFGADLERNVLSVPLDARRAELEALPWVEHATVMRLMPNRLAVAVTERTPVAFVRQGSAASSHIGLVDAHGVLLEGSPDLDSDKSYSFPVVTGIAASDPPGTRAARMKLYLKLTGELDSGPEKISRKLSEVDLTDPEDVKALIPDNGAEVLVHFGDEDFLERYRRYEQNLPEWRSKYPKLASADMRYEREVVLEMQPGAAVPVAGAADADAPAAPGKAASRTAAKTKTHAPVAPKPHAPAAAPVAGKHLEQAFDIKAKAKKAGPR